jgi:hypothetical protein
VALESPQESILDTDEMGFTLGFPSFQVEIRRNSIFSIFKNATSKHVRGIFSVDFAKKA